MSEKKYYVRLKSPRGHRPIWWCGDNSEWQPCGYDLIYGEEIDEEGNVEILGKKLPDFIPSFTKYELGQTMNGDLYTACILEDGHEFYSECKPYTNPLIELVPVEDGEWQK